jgi:glycyl-tRNA synthetase (class II)
VERFNDFIVKDVKDPNKFYRADKLLEEVMDAKMGEKGVGADKLKEYQQVKAQADAYSKEEIHAVFQK